MLEYRKKTIKNITILERKGDVIFHVAICPECDGDMERDDDVFTNYLWKCKCGCKKCSE